MGGGGGDIGCKTRSEAAVELALGIVSSVAAGADKGYGGAGDRYG